MTNRETRQTPHQGALAPARGPQNRIEFGRRPAVVYVRFRPDRGILRARCCGKRRPNILHPNRHHDPRNRKQDDIICHSTRASASRDEQPAARPPAVRGQRHQATIQRVGLRLWICIHLRRRQWRHPSTLLACQFAAFLGLGATPHHPARFDHETIPSVVNECGLIASFDITE